MNKLWKTCKHARTLIKMAFLCSRFDDWWLDAKNSVKQHNRVERFRTKPRGITGFLGGKTPYTAPGFCERNEYIIINAASSAPGREQRTSCTVFNSKPVIKYFSRSGFYGCNVEYEHK